MRTVLAAILSIIVLLPSALSAEERPPVYKLQDLTVVVDRDAASMVRLAAEELRSYVFQLTGTWTAIRDKVPETGPAVILHTGLSDKVPMTGPDPEQNFALYTENAASVRQVVHGATPASTLWGAYTLVESWGVGFYLGGDAVPPQDPDRVAPAVNKTYVPTLKIRGNLPWFNFLNSPTTWNPQDYRTFFEQMSKQKANLIGFHAYDHEPFCAYESKPGVFRKGGPLMTTISPSRWWSPHAMSTSEHLFGTDQFFDRGEWGCEVGIEDAWTFNPRRAAKWQQDMMADALAFAQSRGIRTCIGFEVTGNPDDENVRAELRKRLEQVLAKYPLDYLWIWQSEGGGTGGGQKEVPDDIKEAFSYLPEGHGLAEAERITEFVRLAHKIVKEIDPDVELVVSGWGGDRHMRFTTLYEGLDKVVPEDVIFSALDNIDPTSEPNVSAVYGKVGKGRRCWPIPWFESDAGGTRLDQTGPQVNVIPFEPLLKDIANKKCEGALGIHWRTRNVEDVAGYLYRFGWDPALTAREYLHEYAADHYGADDADAMAKTHIRLEEMGPNYTGAAGCWECSTTFHWFTGPGVAQAGKYEPFKAYNRPDEGRYDELRKMIDVLQTAQSKARKEHRYHAARQYHDLWATIRWLVVRSQLGTAIWLQDGALNKTLSEAETLYSEGKIEEARRLASGVLSDVEKLDFRSALQGLAATCRTRGELGMLTTANARYGRWYATFIRRIEHIIGKPMPEALGPGGWLTEPFLTVFPVPDAVSVGTRVCFDAVIFNAQPNGAVVELLNPDNLNAPAEVLPLVRLGGSYYRAVLEPNKAGNVLWRVRAVTGDKQKMSYPEDGQPPRPLTIMESN